MAAFAHEVRQVKGIHLLMVDYLTNGPPLESEEIETEEYEPRPDMASIGPSLPK